MEAVEAPALSDYLLLEVDGQRIGLPVSAVVEVLPCAAVTPARSQGRIEGFLNVRGAVLPVLSLRERLGRPGRAARLDEHLVRLRTAAHEALVRVDHALDLIGVDAARLQSLDAGSSPFNGAVATEEGLLLIHDPDAFLSPAGAATLGPSR